MKRNNNYAPQLPEEQINKICWELSETETAEIDTITYQIKQIVETEKKKAFKAGLELGRKQKR